MNKWVPAVATGFAAIALIFFLTRKTHSPTVDSDSALNSSPPPGIGMSNSIRTTVSTGSNHVVSDPPSRNSDASTETVFADAIAASGQPVSPRSIKGEIEIPTPEGFDVPPTAVMENMRSVFRQFSSRFSANPVGTNPEIARALDGGNPRQIRFIREEDGLRINEKGELIDPWGTPFFFHQLSAREMEIHSAGPDKIMWTSDDLTIK